MPTIAIKKTIDSDGSQFFPVTHERAVRDDNGNNLESKLGVLTTNVNKAVSDAEEALDTIGDIETLLAAI